MRPFHVDARTIMDMERHLRESLERTERRYKMPVDMRSRLVRIELRPDRPDVVEIMWVGYVSRHILEDGKQWLADTAARELDAYPHIHTLIQDLQKRIADDAEFIARAQNRIRVLEGIQKENRSALDGLRLKLTRAMAICRRHFGRRTTDPESQTSGVIVVTAKRKGNARLREADIRRP